MTIQQLRCFLTMAEELHYTKAANRLHVSQPSLSYSISELEKEWNLPLFVRRENRTVMTDYAKALLPYAVEAVHRLEDVERKASELSDPAVGVINLGIVYSISFDFVPKMLESFYADTRNACVTVNVFQGLSQPLTDQMMAGDIDLMLAGKNDDPGIRSTYMMTQELKLVTPVGHPLAQKNRVTLSDVRDEPLIGLVEKSNIRRHIEKCFRSRGMRANFALSVAECSAMGAFVSAGRGVAIAPIVPSLNSNNVSIIPFAEPDRTLLGREIYLQWAEERYMSSVVKNFRDFLVHRFGESKQA